MSSAISGLSRYQSLYEPSPFAAAGVAASDSDGDNDTERAAGAKPRRGGAAGKTQASGSSGQTLSSDEQAQVDSLKSRDREVRAHEAAHQAAGAGLITRGASYTYKTGPDGKQYAIGGEVGIDSSPVNGDPAATIRKAQRIRSAAMAPANPSGQDRAVAAEAARMAAQAQQELSQQGSTTGSTGSGGGSAAGGTAAQPAQGASASGVADAQHTLAQKAYTARAGSRQSTFQVSA